MAALTSEQIKTVRFALSKYLTVLWTQRDETEYDLAKESINLEIKRVEDLADIFRDMSRLKMY